MAKRRGKNFVAIRLRKQLKAAAEDGGDDCSIRVSIEYYANMRQNICRDLETVSRVEYLNAGYFCKWKGRKIFLDKDAGINPLAFPEGNGIIEQIEKKRRGRC